MTVWGPEGMATVVKDRDVVVIAPRTFSLSIYRHLRALRLTRRETGRILWHGAELSVEELNGA